MGEVVIAPPSCSQRADRASEFALDHDEGFIEPAPARTTRRDRKVGNQIGESGIELACGPVDSGGGLVDVLMVVPATQIDLDIARTQISVNEISGNNAGIAKGRIAVELLLSLCEAERGAYCGVIHQA